MNSDLLKELHKAETRREHRVLSLWNLHGASLDVEGAKVFV